MKIESVDLFYLRMPEVLDIGDGSQDALVFRVRAGNFEGWGEAVRGSPAAIGVYRAEFKGKGDAGGTGGVPFDGAGDGVG